MAAPETARAEAIANALNASTDLTSAIYQVLPDAAGLTRLSDGTYLEVNPAFCRLLGMRREEVIGRTSTELKVWASAAERARLIDALQHNGQVDDLPMVANGRDVAIPGRMFARRVQINGEECLVFVFHDTTQEQRTHTELLAVNTSLAQAGRMARLGAWEDVRGQGLVYWSDVCYDIHGLPPGSALPRRYIETYVAPPWQDAMRANFRQCIAEQTEWSMEIQIIRADGSLRWVRTRGEPVVEDGRVVRIQGVMQDIDEYHRATERLHQSEERFSRMFQLAPYPMGMTRRDNATFIEVNPAWEAMFGFSREEALGRSTTELGILGAQDRAEFLVAAQSSQLLESYELQVTLRNGERRTCLQSMRATEFDGQPCWLFALQDITGRKRQEEEVREREALLSLTLSTAAVGRWDWNLHTGMISGDERWRSMHGLPAGTMKGPAFLWTEPLGPEEVLRVTTEVTRHVNQPETPFDTTFCIRRPHEKERWIRNLGKVVSLDAEGQPERMLGIALDVTAQHEQENLLRYLANYDTLTGLPNRALLSERLGRAIVRARRQETRVAVLFLDLDRFKEVNDSLGHAEGDALLVQAAARLRELMRETDTICRLGGDEFVLLLPDTGQPGASRLASKVVAAFDQPFIVAGHSLRVTVSVGVALYPHDGATFGELLKNADAALYRAKHEGRNTWAFYAREMNVATFERLVLESQLRKAIGSGQLRAYFQPKVRLDDGRPVGAEALVRWLHPDHGLIPPERFIPVAEASDLVVDLGDWMLAEACRQLAVWRGAGLPPLTIAVNLAARHFRDPSFIERIERLLAIHGLPAQTLELELTESILLEAGARTAETFLALRRLGLGLAIDDFGAGYSNLGYLKRLPLTALKIDQNFVQNLVTDPDDRILAATIVALGHGLGLKVVAEGVETEEQRRILLDQGCDWAQGYLFAPPMPAERFADWLARASITG